MRKESNRPRRVAELIKRELAMAIPRELDDARTRDVTLTEVDVSPDLKNAKIYFTLLAGSAGAAPVVEALNRAANHLRHLLAKQIQLRVVPRLRFQFDESIERGDRIAQLINRAMAEDGKAESSRTDRSDPDAKDGGQTPKDHDSGNE